MIKIIRFFLYPIKYLLRHKVELYKCKLKEIRFRQQHMVPKARRTGMQEIHFIITSRDTALATKYDKYIEKWSL